MPSRVNSRQVFVSSSLARREDGNPLLTKEPKLLINDNNAGKPESIGDYNLDKADAPI
jgi:hypothetical protein